MSKQKERTKTDTAQSILLLVGYKVPKKVIDSWSDKRMEQVVDYCSAVHLQASDNKVKIPRRPLGLTKYAFKSDFKI